MWYAKQAFAWAVFTRESKFDDWRLHSMHWSRARALWMADDVVTEVSTLVRRVRWQFADKPPKRPTFNRDKPDEGSQA